VPLGVLRRYQAPLGLLEDKLWSKAAVRYGEKDAVDGYLLLQQVVIEACERIRSGRWKKKYRRAKSEFQKVREKTAAAAPLARKLAKLLSLDPRYSIASDKVVTHSFAIHRIKLGTEDASRVMASILRMLEFGLTDVRKATIRARRSVAFSAMLVQGKIPASRVTGYQGPYAGGLSLSQRVPGLESMPTADAQAALQATLRRLGIFWDPDLGLLSFHDSLFGVGGKPPDPATVLCVELDARFRWYDLSGCPFGDSIYDALPTKGKPRSNVVAAFVNAALKCELDADACRNRVDEYRARNVGPVVLP